MSTDIYALLCETHQPNSLPSFLLKSSFQLLIEIKRNNYTQLEITFQTSKIYKACGFFSLFGATFFIFPCRNGERLISNRIYQSRMNDELFSRMQHKLRIHRDRLSQKITVSGKNSLLLSSASFKRNFI